MTTFRVVMSGSIFGNICQNVLHFDSGDVTTVPAALASELNTQWLPSVRNLQNQNWVWTQHSIQVVAPTVQPAEPFILSGQVGVLSGEAGPTFASGLFSIRTATSGRTGHGRFYLPGLHLESMENGIFQSGAFAAFQNAANALRNRFGLGGTGLFRLGVAPRNNPTAFKTCTAIVVRQTFGVQRRRNFGVGG